MKKDRSILTVSLEKNTIQDKFYYNIKCLTLFDKNLKILSGIQRIIKAIVDDGSLNINTDIDLFEVCLVKDGDNFSIGIGTDQTADILKIYDSLFDTLIDYIDQCIKENSLVEKS